MNRFIKKYKEERKAGSNEYEALGVVVAHIVVKDGTLDDVNMVYDYFHEDLMESMEKFFNNASKHAKGVTLNELKMKESGHKLSDFE